MKRTFVLRALGVATMLVALSFAGVAGAAALTGSGAVSTSSGSFDPLRLIPNTKDDSDGATTKTVPVPVVPSSTSGTQTRQSVLASQNAGCPAPITGTVGSAPSKVSPKGVHGTTSADLASFAFKYNDTRVAHCLRPVPLANFRYGACMETRLFWMAEDPSTDPSSAWGHIGSVRSDGVPSVGCDGNLAGGLNNSGATVATKWWNSLAHRTSLYKPSYTGSTANVCVYFAITHGGVPNEPYEFTRAAAIWTNC